MRELDSFEIIPEAPKVANGIPRSAWFRTRRRATWYRSYAVLLVIFDLAAVALVSLLTITLIRKATAGFQEALPLFHLIAYALLPVGWVVVLWGQGAYDRRYLGLGTDEFKRVVRAAWTMMAIVSFLALVLKADLSRVAVAVGLVGALVVILVFRYGARRLLQLARAHGLATHRMLLVGTLPESMEVLTTITRSPSTGLVPVGIHASEGYSARLQEPPVPVFAGRDVVALVRELGADTIAVCGSASTEPGELRRLAWQLEGTGVDLVVAPQLTDIAGPRVHIRPVAGLPLLYVEEPTLSGLAWLVKNLIDRLVAAGRIRSSRCPCSSRSRSRSGSPTRARCSSGSAGSAGRARSSGCGSSARCTSTPRTGSRSWRSSTRATACCSRSATIRGSSRSAGSCAPPPSTNCPSWSTSSSARCPWSGRAPLPAEDGDFLGDVRRRLLVRPGITGLWQVSGRSDLSLGRRGAARPLLRGQLVAGARPAHAVAHDRRRPASQGRVLAPTTGTADAPPEARRR